MLDWKLLLIELKESWVILISSVFVLSMLLVVTSELKKFELTLKSKLLANKVMIIEIRKLKVLILNLLTYASPPY